MPSGNSTLLFDSVHSPSISIHTRPLIPGPILTGLWSLMNTALLPQPLANAIAADAKAITIPNPSHISIDSHGATLHALFEPREQGECDLRDDSIEHVT